MSDGAQGGTADFADTLGNRVSHRVDLIGLLVQHDVVVAEMWAAHVPMEVFGFQVQRKNIGQDAVHGS